MAELQSAEESTHPKNVPFFLSYIQRRISQVCFTLESMTICLFIYTNNSDDVEQPPRACHAGQPGRQIQLANTEHIL